MSSFGSHESIGDPPGMDPEPDRGPCADCLADSARTKILDSFNDFKSAVSLYLPLMVRRIETRMGDYVASVALDCYDEVLDTAYRGDNAPCKKHASTRDDEC